MRSVNRNLFLVSEKTRKRIKPENGIMNKGWGFISFGFKSARVRLGGFY